LKPSISVIIAYRNALAHLDRCLAAVRGSRHQNYELILVDDASTDESSRIAGRYTDRIITLPSRCGPAAARNRAAEQAQAEILFFVDADVICFPNTLDIVDGIFQQNPDLDAVIGSYDDDPPETNFLSRYKNLTHHFVHQKGSTEASTFWTGCGGIRRQVFMSMKGFDEAYRVPSIEDIELGYRLKRAGKRILLCKHLVVKHAKRWTLPSLLRSDVMGRAIPWTVLQLSYGEILDDLNLERTQRASAFLVCLAALLGMLGLLRWWFSLGITLCLVPVLYWNRDLYQFYHRCGGLWFAMRATVMHWVYYIYSALAFGMGLLKYRLSQ
jgi:glycosyltransferase involved in cell wall biosynthesis